MNAMDSPEADEPRGFVIPRFLNPADMLQPGDRVEITHQDGTRTHLCPAFRGMPGPDLAWCTLTQDHDGDHAWGPSWLERRQARTGDDTPL